jgi:hypothetical protein
MSALIVAPHVDDELIGCFSVLTERTDVTVMYLEEVSPVREREARKAAEVLKFEPVLPPFLTSLSGFDSVYVPCRQDKHPEHKKANAIFRTQATHFYSVDMDQGARYLGQKQALRKLALLDDLYPSQFELWRYDARYWLFEHIRESDFEVYTTVVIRGHTITVLDQYASIVGNVFRDGHSTQKTFNLLVSLCRSGRVTMQTPDGKEYSI